MSTSRKSLIGVCRKLIGLAVITAVSLAAGCSGSNGSAGKNGANGDAGVNGTSCSVTDNHDGTLTIRCSDGTSATVSNGASGDAGINGTSCTLTSNDAGARTISCGDAGGFTVLQGVVDYVIMTPDERAQATTAQPCTGVVATCSLAAPCSAQGTTLVSSPIVAACSACHDSAIAIDHMQTNGGSFYEPRSTAFTKPQKEECLLCHGPGRLASIADRHAVQP